MAASDLLHPFQFMENRRRDKYEGKFGPIGSGRTATTDHIGALKRADKPAGEHSVHAGRAIKAHEGHIFGHGQGPLGHEPEQRSPYIAKIW